MTRSIPVRGRWVRVRESGDASLPTLLLLHGITRSLEDWDPTFEALEGEYRLIAPDLAGYGWSAPHPDGAGLAALAIGTSGGPGLTAVPPRITGMPATALRVLAPALLLLGLWLVFAGSSGPGGAFQSGAVFAGLLDAQAGHLGRQLDQAGPVAAQRQRQAGIVVEI